METQTGRKQALATSQRNRILIAANPTAGARAIDSPIDRLAAAITNAGFEPTRHHDLGQFAVDAAAARESDQLHAVIAAGGDGTASAVANRIAPDVPLLVFPLGTENLLARYLGIRADPAQACDILRTGDKLQMDAGLANGRMFLLMASCGFDAEVVRRVHQRRRGHITRLSYVQPTLESLHEYPHPDIRVYCDAAADDATNPQVLGKWVFVMNVTMYAGGMPIVGWMSVSSNVAPLFIIWCISQACFCVSTKTGPTVTFARPSAAYSNLMSRFPINSTATSSDICRWISKSPHCG